MVVDRGYRGHNAPPEHRFKVYISGQKRRIPQQIKRIATSIGYLKSEHRMGRSHIAHATGDAVNVVLAAASYNLRRLLAWLALLLSVILTTLETTRASRAQPAAA